MVRTQIYLPDDLHQKLVLLAKQEKTSLSGLIREGAKTVTRKREKRCSSYSWLDEITGMFFAHGRG